MEQGANFSPYNLWGTIQLCVRITLIKIHSYLKRCMHTWNRKCTGETTLPSLFQDPNLLGSTRRWQEQTPGSGFRGGFALHQTWGRGLTLAAATVTPQARLQADFNKQLHQMSQELLRIWGRKSTSLGKMPSLTWALLYTAQAPHPCASYYCFLH